MSDKIDNKVEELKNPSCRGVELKDTSDWQRIGSIDVDAGICWLGDPCYILPDKREGIIDKGGLFYTDMLNAMFANDIENKHSIPYR